MIWGIFVYCKAHAYGATTLGVLKVARRPTRLGTPSKVAIAPGDLNPSGSTELAAPVFRRVDRSSRPRVSAEPVYRNDQEHFNATGYVVLFDFQLVLPASSSMTQLTASAEVQADIELEVRDEGRDGRDEECDDRQESPRGDSC
jgi:hypothetical protein